MRLLTPVLVGLALMTPALGQEYTADTVLDFFVKQGTGAPRAICIGTAEACPPAPAQAAFDVLVNFPFDSAELTPEAMANLAQVADALRDERLRDVTFLLEGHTDAKGSAAYNQALSARRAEAVGAFLREAGVPQNLRTEGVGEQSPRVADPEDPINRRVELRIEL